ncbi:MAG: hypothetical protein V4793_03970, partial [Paraburkholderia tropica]
MILCSISPNANEIGDDFSDILPHFRTLGIQHKMRVLGRMVGCTEVRELLDLAAPAAFVDLLRLSALAYFERRVHE